MLRHTLPILALLLGGCVDQKSNTTIDLDEDEPLRPASQKESIRGREVKSPSTPSSLITRTILQKVEVLIPRAFEPMDEETIALKYPLKQGSAFQVYTDEDATVNIAFEHTPNRATLQDLPAIQQVFEQQFNQPGIDFRQSGIRKIHNRDFVVIEMVTPAIDTDVYNLMFVTSYEERLLIGTFNCALDKLAEWKPIAEQIVNSVKVKD